MQCNALQGGTHGNFLYKNLFIFEPLESLSSALTLRYRRYGIPADSE